MFSAIITSPEERYPANGLTKDIPLRFTSQAEALAYFRSNPVTIEEAQTASVLYKTTFSDDELQDIIRRVEGCRVRFIEQGDGDDRVKCLCSVFRHAKTGNGGNLPDVGGWPEIYAQLQFVLFEPTPQLKMLQQPVCKQPPC
jgi:hypothetical protein